MSSDDSCSYNKTLPGRIVEIIVGITHGTGDVGKAPFLGFFECSVQREIVAGCARKVLNF